MKKPCAGCGKQIPEAALHCVFCGAKQEAAAAASSEPSDAPLPTSAGAAVPSSASEGVQAAGSADATGGEVAPIAPRRSTKADVTLLGLRVEDVQAAMNARAAEPAPNGDGVPEPPEAASELHHTPHRGLPVVEEPAAPARPTAPLGLDVDPNPFGALVRLVMASGGLVLIALFSLPWRGASSWQLLETLAGADFVRQLYFLAGGAILLATALLPVPGVFRAVVGAFVAAVPLVLGAEGLLDGWRGLGAALAVIALPATHLMRTRRAAQLDPRARALVILAAGAVAIMYLVPVSSVVPLVYLARLLGSMTVGQTVVGLFIGIPLVLAALSLLGALGRDLASVAVLLSVLILLWAPAAVLIFVNDGTQLYLALALLWTSATAALCVAQLLTLAAAARRA